MNLGKVFLQAILVASFVTAHEEAIAQHHFQDGFVITTKNDTLVGKLNNLHKHAHVYIDFLFPNGRDTVFTPNHIASYEIGNQRFEVVPIPHATKDDTTYLFAQVLVEGYANLYKTKIKLDPISPAEEAFLGKKYNENVYMPVGNLKSLTVFFKDYTSLHEELVSNSLLYTNNLQTKLQLFNHYNSWKRHELDSLANLNVSTANVKVEKYMTELFLDANHNLTPETKFHLDEITGQLATNPALEMVIEFVNTGSEASFAQKTMKAVKLHLNEFDARIRELVINIPENQEIKPSKANGQIVYYYFK